MMDTDTTWRDDVRARQTDHPPKERAEPYYYSDGLGHRRQTWLEHNPGMDTPMRVKTVWQPGLRDDDADAMLKMNIGSERDAYKLYRALERYFEDRRSVPWFLQGEA